jgi:hypothetical protein
VFICDPLGKLGFLAWGINTLENNFQHTLFFG